jgi:diguanylate cyclase (GGDEF)-like protein/PAS domain S-box-containing protein
MCLVCCSLWGQQAQVRFENLTLNEGLSQLYALCLFQDERGFLWIGTQDGLNRYDGYGFVWYKHDLERPDSMVDNHITALCAGPDGQIWVGTDGAGLDLLNPRTNTAVHYTHNPNLSQSLSNNRVRALYKDRKGHLWVGTDQGLNRLTDNGFERYLDGTQSQRNQVNAIFQDRASVLWIGTSGGLSSFDPLRKDFEHFRSISQGSEPIAINSICEDSSGFLWLGSDTGLYRFNRQNGSYTQLLDEYGAIYSVASGDDGTIWVGTQGQGLVHLDVVTGVARQFKNDPGNPDSLAHDEILTVSRDHSGLLWIGSRGGVSKLNWSLDAFDWYYADAPGNGNRALRNVWSLYEDVDDLIWMGTNAGLVRFDPKDDSYRIWRHEPDNPDSLSHDQIRDILRDEKGKFWVATRGGGLNLYDSQRNKFKAYRHDREKPTSLSHDQAWVIYEDNQQTLWVGTDGGGLNLYNPSTDDFTSLLNEPGNPTSLSNNRVSSLLEDRSQRFWVGTFGGGLNLFDRDSKLFKSYRSKRGDSASLSHDRVLCIYEDLSGVLWIGTWGGFNRFEPETESFRVYREKDGLSNDVVYGILGDKDGFLWMSTNHGLCRFSPFDESFRVYERSDGLQSNEFNSGSYFLGRNGRMFFGGAEGFNAFFPDKVVPDPSTPKMVITGFDLPNSERDRNFALHKPSRFDDRKAVTLNHSDYLFTISFVGLHFAAPQKNQYAYMLDGLDEKWIYTNADRRFATYTSLPHGSYRFRVKGSNKDGVWSGSAAMLDILIQPPPWRTAWAYVGYFILGFLLMVGVIYAWRRKLAYERRVAETLRQSERRLKFALWGSGDEHWDWDLQAGNIFRSNQSGVLSFPSEADQTSVDNLANFVHPHDFPRLVEAWEDLVSGRKPHFEATYRVRGNRQEWVWILDRGKIVGRDEHGEPSRISGTIKDVSKIKETEEKLSLIAIAFENTADGVFITDNDFIIAAVNPAYTRITGKSREEVLGRPYKLPRVKDQDGEFEQNIFHQVESEGQWHGEVWDTRKNQEPYQIELHINAVQEADTEVTHYVGVFSDISFRKRAEAELRHLANYDLLTNLPNRTLFYEHLENMINEAPRTGRRFAILFFDLDNFKHINDSLGHGIGDLLLTEVGKRLMSCIREEDIVARFGGDEFSMLLKDIGALHGAAKVAEKTIRSLERPFQLDGHNIVISPSIGIVLFPTDGRDADDLLRNADTAMYHAKNKGKNNFQFFTEEMNQRALQRLQMEHDLRDGIENDELVLFYQPKVSFTSGEIIGMEVLVRWISPKHGFVSPGRFIPIAEETGLVIPMGRLILRKTCLETKKWFDQGLINGRVSVNYSALQFRQKDLLTNIDQILKDTNFPPKCLELEITEGALMDNPGDSVALMQNLRKRGIHLTIDDFGTGFSSLSYLRQFPVHSLKVDRSFVVEMAHQEDDRTIVAAIIGLAHNLRLQVVAEGVETPEQVKVLRELKCDEMQGYLFSKPLDEQQFEALLQAKPNLYE